MQQLLATPREFKKHKKQDGTIFAVPSRYITYLIFKFITQFTRQMNAIRRERDEGAGVALRFSYHQWRIPKEKRYAFKKVFGETHSKYQNLNISLPDVHPRLENRQKLSSVPFYCRDLNTNHRSRLYLTCRAPRLLGTQTGSLIYKGISEKPNLCTEHQCASTSVAEVSTDFSSLEQAKQKKSIRHFLAFLQSMGGSIVRAA